MNGVGTPRCNPTTGANCTLAPKSSIPREAQIDELWIVKDAKKDPVLGAHGTITCLHVYLRLTLINDCRNFDLKHHACTRALSRTLACAVQ